jgi:hypothetical protein
MHFLAFSMWWVGWNEASKVQVIVNCILRHTPHATTYRMVYSGAHRLVIDGLLTKYIPPKPPPAHLWVKAAVRPEGVHACMQSDGENGISNLGPSASFIQSI